MLVAFALAMPRINTWNGRWSGEDQLYARVMRLDRATAERVLSNKSYYYDFGDGWAMSISVRRVDSKEAAKIRRKSAGFMLYDWAIDSIIRHGRITTEDVEAAK